MTTIGFTIPNPAIESASRAGSQLRTRGDGVRALRAAVRSEWIKLVTLRINKVILAATAAVGGLTAWALAMSSTDLTLTSSELFIFPLPLVATMATVVGILMATAEVQHGTLAGVLSARPRRMVVVVAKTATAAVVGVVLGAVGMLAGFGGAALGGAGLGSGSEVVSRSLWALLYIGSAAVVGLGVGLIVRHSAGAISGLLMWSFVVENLFAPALPDGVVHFLPFSAGYRLLDAGPAFEPPVDIASELARPQYALIFGGYALISLVVGTVLLHRRDTV